MTWIILLALITGSASSTKSFETDTLKTANGNPLKITFIGHGSLLINFNGQTIYIDPVSDYADYPTLPKADVILITHEHADHLDPKAISALEKNKTILIANPSSQQKLGKGTALKNGEQLKPTSYLELEAVPAYNTTPGRDVYHPRHRDNGYILTIDGTRIYIAGDTEDIPEMQKLKDIDIAFLPVNQPYTMTVAQAAHAAQMVMPHVLYPYHYGNTDIQSLKDSLKNTPSIDVRIRQLQ